jgi:hypothetical protein
MVVVAAFAANAASLPGCYDHRDAAADEIGCKRREPIVLIFGPAVFDRHVLTSAD